MYRIVYGDSQFLLLVHSAAGILMLIDCTFRDPMTQIFHILLSNSQRLSSTVSLREIEKLPLRIENSAVHL
ncbi:hypothetical protein BV902_16005 [Sphingobacterium sp. B29]|nr:hypothetical protein BV902_16005 [Sphingobacterium sp. B29]